MSNFQAATFAVPGTLAQWATFTLTEWPKHGWVSGRGDAEQGEAESSYSRNRSGGAWRASTTICEPGFFALSLAFASTIGGAPSSTPAGIPGGTSPTTAP